MADHRHRRDRREAGDPVRAVCLDGVHVRRGDHLAGLGPAHPNQPALTSGLLITATTLGIGLNVGPRQHRVTQAGFGFAEHLHQHAPRIRVPHPGGRVAVPGERRTTGTTARLVFGPVRAHRRIVGLLGFPGDDPVVDVDLPRARSGAVDPVCGPDHLVVAPPVAIEHVTLSAAAPGNGAQIGRELARCEEAPTALQQLLERSADVRCASQGISLLLKTTSRLIAGFERLRRESPCNTKPPSVR